MGDQRPLIDISRPLSASLATWPGDQPFELDNTARISQGAPANVSSITLSTHAGTHVDAPWHVLPNGVRLGEIPLETFVGPCVVCDLSQLERHVEADDLDKSSIASGVTRLLIKTRSSGSRSTEGNIFDPHFIALTPSAAEWIAHRPVDLVGIDSPSVEPFDGSGEVHHRLLSDNVILLEGLDLQQVDAGDYLLVCLPLSLPDADGSPCRAVLLPTNGLSDD